MAKKEIKKPIANKDYKSAKQLARQEERKKAVKGAALRRVLIPVVAVVLAVALAVVGVIAGYNAVLDNGSLSRSRVAMQSRNYKVTNAMMSYYVYSEYYAYVGSDEEAANKGIDPKVSLKKQSCSLYTSGSWFDYFLSQAMDATEEMLTNLEAAKADGVTLSDEELNEVKTAAESTKLSMYGRGLKTEDVRTAMEYRALSQKYETALKEKITAEMNVGDGAAKSADVADKDGLASFGEVGQYASDNYDAFTQYEYVKYTVTYSTASEEEETEETAEPTAAPTAEPTAEPTVEPTAEPSAEPTEAPSGLRSRDEAKALADKLVETLGTDPVDLAAFRAAVSEVFGEGAGETVYATVGNAQTNDNGIADFAADEENAAGALMLKNDAAFEDATAGTFTVYALLTKPHLMTDRAANYLVIGIDAKIDDEDEEADNTAAIEEVKKVADELLAKVKGLTTKEEVEKVLEAYKDNELVEVYVSEASANYVSLDSEVTAWMFGTNREYPRTAGDAEIFGDYDEYGIAVFQKYADEADWYASAYNTVLQNKMTAHYAEVTRDVPVVSRYNYMDSIPVRK